MKIYISWKSTWDILYENEFNGANPDISMLKLIKLLRKGHGTYDVRDNKLIFVEYYDLMDYKWSTSVIASSEKKYKVEKRENLLLKIEEEREVITWLLDQVNNRFDGYDQIYLNVFFERNFLDNNIRLIRAKHSLHNNRYYEIVESAEYLVKRAWCLLTPPKALLDMIESN